MPYVRALKFAFPLISGDDVLNLQRRLRDLGYASTGQPDGIFGARTDAAVRAFQENRSLKVDGIVGPVTWNVLFQDVTADIAFEKIRPLLDELKKQHGFHDSILWHLDKNGLFVDGKLETTKGDPRTVRRVWDSFSAPLDEWSKKFGVPVELIIATICTESGGDPAAVREEPGFVSDERTSNKVSPGLMQTLISTAQATLGDGSINRQWLLEPANSIRAGTSYIASQWKATGFDPPKVACAYNAGGVYYNRGEENRWKMRQFPINTGYHADRFVKWFNDCFRCFANDGVKPEVSFFTLVG